MLNGREMIDRGIIFGNLEEENISQHGIDLCLIKVERLSEIGRILKKGKTILPKYIEIEPLYDTWFLGPGSYNITFEQGCKVPNDQMLLIRQRSSLLRNGGMLHSSVFDAGFETQNIGTVMVLSHPIEIEVGARIAQIYNHECTPVENLYNGQFQNDKQRK